MTIHYSDLGCSFSYTLPIDKHAVTASNFQSDLKTLYSEVAQANGGQYNEEDSHESMLLLIEEVLPVDVKLLKEMYQKFIQAFPLPEFMLTETEKNQPSTQRAYLFAKAIEKKYNDLSENKTVLLNRGKLESLQKKERERIEETEEKLRQILHEQNNFLKCTRCISQLNNLITNYEKHLQKAHKKNSKDKLLEEKIEIVSQLKQVFETSATTPEKALKQLKKFQEILEKNQEILKKSRGTSVKKLLKAIAFLCSLAFFWVFIDKESDIFHHKDKNSSTFLGFMYHRLTHIEGHYFFKQANLNTNYELDTTSWFCKDNTILIKDRLGKLEYCFKDPSTGFLQAGTTNISTPIPLTDESVQCYKKDILRAMQARFGFSNLEVMEEGILKQGLGFKK